MAIRASLGTLLNLSKPFFGPTTYVLPWAAAMGGLVGAPVGVLLLALWNFTTMRLLVLGKRELVKFTSPQPTASTSRRTDETNRNQRPKAINSDEIAGAEAGLLVEHNSAVDASAPAEEYLTYSDLGSAAFKQGGTWVALTIVVAVLGGCSGYLILVSDNIRGLTDVPHWVCVLCCVPVCLVLSFVRNVRWFAVTSAVGLVCTSAVVGITIFCAFDQLRDNDVSLWPQLAKMPLVDMNNFPLFFGGVTFLFCAQPITLALEQSMPITDSDARERLFLRMLSTSMALVGIFSGAFGVLGTAAFGSSVNSVLPLNFGKFPTLQAASRVLMIIDVLTVYPLILFAGVELFEQIVIGSSAADKSAPLRPARRNFLRFVLVGITAAVAIVSPNFGGVMALVGASAGSLFAYVYPPLFYLRIRRARSCLSEKIGMLLMVALGIAVLVSATWSVALRVL